MTIFEESLIISLNHITINKTIELMIKSKTLMVMKLLVFLFENINVNLNG